MNCQTLLVAGNLTTADLIADALWLLLRRPSLACSPVFHGLETLPAFEAPQGL